jgi:hypothetical protein
MHTSMFPETLDPPNRLHIVEQDLVAADTQACAKAKGNKLLICSTAAYTYPRNVWKYSNKQLISEFLDTKRKQT